MFKKLILKLFNVYPNFFSFKEIYDLIGFPIVTFTQDGKKYHFLLDTGANDNIIDANLLSQIKHEKLEGTGTLSGLDGIVSEVTSCNITMSYKGQDYPYMYLIRDMKDTFDLFKKDFGVQLSGILGTKFFAEYKYVIDFKDFIAYSKS